MRKMFVYIWIFIYLDGCAFDWKCFCGVNNIIIVFKIKKNLQHQFRSGYYLLKNNKVPTVHNKQRKIRAPTN